MTSTMTTSNAFEGLARDYLRDYTAVSSAIAREVDPLRRSLLIRKRSMLLARLSLESNQIISDMRRSPTPRVGLLRRWFQAFLCV